MSSSSPTPTSPSRSPRRVLVLSSVFPSRTRPTYGVFVRERVRHVARHCEVIVVSPIPWFPLNRLIRGRDRTVAPLRENEGGLPVYHPRFLCPPRVGKSADGILYFLSLLPFVAWLRRRFPFDLIDAHFTYPDGFAGVLLGKVFARPAVVTVRGSHDVRHAGYALRRPQVGLALTASARVIAVSESLRAFAVGLGASPDRVRVIPNGVDPDRFAPTDRGHARDSLGLDRDRIVLLAVGGLIEGKGHHRVIEILPDLAARHPNILYVAVGEPALGDDYAARLERLVRERNLREHVRIVPPRPHHEIPTWMAAADLFCLATRNEGWCNSIMESLACGVPVVTTRVGGNPELVRDGLDGFLVPFWNGEAFRDAILQALARRWDREEISRRLRQRGWDHTAELVVMEFDRALASASLDAARPMLSSIRARPGESRE